MDSDDGRSDRRDWMTKLLDLEQLWSVLALVAIITIVGTELGVRTYDYEAGDIVEADIIAPVDLRVSDPESTARRRAVASEAVLDVYDFDPFAWREPVASLNALFAWGREEVASRETGWGDLSPEMRAELVREAEEVVGVRLPEGLIRQGWQEGFTAETELALEPLLRNLVQHSLLGTTDALGLLESQSLRIRDIGSGEERVLDDLGAVLDLESARARVRRQVAETLELAPATEEVIGDFLALLLRPNLTYNSAETQARKQRAADSVEPVFYQLKRGRAILREGDPVTEQSLLELRALQEQWSGGSSRRMAAGVLLLAALAILSLWRYVEHERQRGGFQRVKRLYHLLLLLLVGSVLLTRLGLFVADAVAGALPEPPFNVAESYVYAVPFATGSLVAMLLTNVHCAWVYAAVQAIIVGAMSGDLSIALFSLLGSVAAVYGMSRFSERTEMLRTGMTVAAVNVVSILGLGLLAQPTPPWSLLAFQIVLGIVGGIQVALVASALLPVLESVFNTMTDVKLLELSNMNLPLLKELAVVAPGTYHHSVVIGTLAEKGAEAIGANPLFARVAAYYHDIGKMRQPEYFVENQKEGNNPHDRLSPHMSALILVRHVKDGVVYAREHGLPEPLIDVIPQHHGTRLMRYFYERARAQAGPDTGQVSESDFRYPGPKPQSKEAALIMLADGVEARSRLIDDPSPRKLREMIQDNVREVLEDRQLDECDLTLQDLALIGDAFLAVLSGMHHHRIEYPEASVPEPGKGREQQAAGAAS